jgi:pimeloyl-ACP methyl ester carboxylesterase
MGKLWKWMWRVLFMLVLTVAAFVWGYAPIRARRAAARDEAFRARFQAQHDAIDAPFHHKDRTVNGLQWHYVDEGPTDGEVILFLHGLPEGWYSWRYVLPLVDHKYRLIAIDMKGYGRSEKQDADYNWHHVAQQTADLMEALGIHKYYVVSHDWGTIIGSVLVGDHPEHILGYVRMEADLIRRAAGNQLEAYMKKPQWLLFQSYWMGTYFMQDPAGFLDLVYSPKRMTTPFKAEDRDYLAYEFSRPGVAAAVPHYFLAENWDLDAAIGKICANTLPFPVLQLQADHDPAQPPSLFADVSSQCPHVKLEWVKDASHFSNFDQPAQVADAINRFVHSTKP